jgi:hypothetical protein
MSDERQTSTKRTGRREALKMMGQYAAYTAPALIALSLPQEAAADRPRSRAFKRKLARKGDGWFKRGKVAHGRDRGRSPRPHVSRA